MGYLNLQKKKAGLKFDKGGLTLKEISMLKGAKLLVQVNAGVKENEKVLIVTDTENFNIAKALASAVKMIGAEYTIGIMEPRSTHGEEPTDCIAKAMLGADVVFAPTKYSLSHSKARENANEKGVRFVSMPDYSYDILTGISLEADFIGILKTVNKLAEILDSGNSVHITTSLGTDITLNIKNRIANKVSSVCTESGSWGCPPNIEVNISPIEEETNGMVVVDGSIPIPQVGLIESPIKMEVKKGSIISFHGDRQAKDFETTLMSTGNKNSLILGEFGIGLNPNCIVKGSMLEDEGALGTIHFGWGHNYDQGGNNIAPTHIDTVIKNPTVTIDGKTIIKEGKLII
jgi:2,5-dihydroxypyridine 5,6-dioxygenase